jgi:Domain of unknown function (DUF4349)
MSEPRIDEIVRELRGTAPPAPQHLRERIRALPEPEARRTFRVRLRPALAGAAAAAVLLGIGAAAINGLTENSTPSKRESLGAELGGSGRESGTFEKRLGRRAPVGTVLAPTGSRRDAGAVPPSVRLQTYHALLHLRVRNRDDLSDAMKRAVLETRRLGGYVVFAQYAQAAQGDGSLIVRVPITRVQDAIASFSNLGTILEQRISLQDIQPQADRLAKSIASKKRRIAELQAKRARTRLTPAEQAELAAAQADLARLTQRRAAVIRQGAYARVSLGLTTRKAAAPTEKDEQGAFGSFLDDAGTIFALEAIAVLYALVVVGPFVLLAAFAFLGERARRRRANHALLERSGQTG